ncbi:hypothetical protein [Roseitranquillus sediminis]|nr:hypothetical protein [Roseitranquillus sediminis]MBM9593943.1 hypothetical protein [Roseitranquillus sediminis]
MPKQIHEEIGKIYRTRTVKTFGDKVKETLGGIAVLVFVLWIIVSILTG